MMKNTIHLILTVMLIACQGNAQTEIQFKKTSSQVFNDYWYAGKAELNSYVLQQSRYGEMHEGDAVLIFVTEDFSKEKQVKLDRPINNSKDKVSVMKLNFTKKFTTGIYPYSMMFSCFTPVKTEEFPNSLKVTSSSQEWCGHTYTQINKAKNQFILAGFSYFESEGDIAEKLDLAILEDELWNKIRLAPGELPTGNFDMIPSTFSSRLMHDPLSSVRVLATLETGGEHPEFGQLLSYNLTYKEPKRALTIKFSENFPHTIVSWEETNYTKNGKALVTQAKLKKSMQLDYWNKNKPQDLKYRAQLGLD